MNARKASALVALVAGLALLVAGPAAAKKNPSPPLSEQTAVAWSDGAQELRVAPGPVTANLMAVTGGCRNIYVWRSGTNSIGSTLWKYILTVEWCWDGYRITSLFRQPRGEVYYPLWSYSPYDAANAGGVGSSYAYTWRQGHFALCAMWCAQHTYPWIGVTARADGSYSWSTG